MSLRRDVHAAFDQIAPPLGGMPERVVQTVLSDTKRRKRGMFTYRARVPLPLVAAFVVVALVAAALIGNQLIQAWNASHSPSPAGGVHLTAVQQLEARPLRLPIYKSLNDCVSGPYNTQGAFGAGPIYGEAGSSTTTNWGEYYYNVFYSDAVIRGPILIRVRDLLTGQTIVFAGAFAAGPSVGTDVVDGNRVEQRTELVLDEASATIGGGQPGWATNHSRYVWDFLAGVPKGSSGSTGWQIDGPRFTEIFLAC